MNMSEPMSPYKPEKTIICEITIREAIMIQEIRKYPHGNIAVHKQNNKIVRVEPKESILITEDTEITLPIVE